MLKYYDFSGASFLVDKRFECENASENAAPRFDGGVAYTDPGTYRVDCTLATVMANFDLWGVAEKRRKKRKKKRKKRKKKEGFSTESWVSKLYPFWVFFGDNCSYFLALYPGFGQS